MPRSRSRPIALAGALALATMALFMTSQAANADVVLNTPDAYTGSYFENAAILGWTTNAQVTAFMAANGGSLASFTTATGPAASTFAPVVVVPGFPIPPWLANSASSSWIGPSANGAADAAGVPPLAPFVNTGAGYSSADSSPQGFFAYTTTFNLGAPPTSTVGLKWTSDNQGVAIYLNGKNEGDVNPGDFTAFTPFTLNSADFVTGLNSLTFVVYNEEFGGAHASPTGIRIEGTIVTAVPEPGMMTLAAVGALPILGLYWARRRRAQA
jgi:hypothetical protein